MNTLHLLNHSPFSGKQLTNCLLFANPKDAIMLTGDAVYALQENITVYQQLLQSKLPLFVLEEDLLARAIHVNIDHVTIVNYVQFVELCTQYSKINSWL